jgi:ubiquinol-cytochrome c reductase cytochrome c1 subunit
MVRLIAFVVGLIFSLAVLYAAFLPREDAPSDPSKALYKHPMQVDFQQDGPLGWGVLGTFDRPQLQRGFQVYKEVCAACHGLERLAFRNLQDIGFSEAEVKAIAKAYDVPSVDEKTGEPSTRKAVPSDYFPSPYPNEVAARAANNNALPPDLSLITKAREEGQEYLYSLLVGYKAPPAGHEVPQGLHFNPYFPNLNIAMPPPLTSTGQVTYAPGHGEGRHRVPRIRGRAEDRVAPPDRRGGDALPARAHRAQLRHLPPRLGGSEEGQGRRPQRHGLSGPSLNVSKGRVPPGTRPFLFARRAC